MTPALLRELVAINSIFPHEAALAKFMRQWVQQHTPAEVKTQLVQPGRRNVICRIPGQQAGGRAVLLAGHLDTVPEVNGWSHPPHQPRQQDGKLSGLGAWDMKAGNAVLLACLAQYRPTYYDLVVAFTVDEENYSAGAHALIDGGYCQGVTEVLVPEPGFTHGDRGITIGRTGRASFQVRIVGRSAHGSFPQDGVNAITLASRFLAAVGQLQFGRDPEMGDTTVYPRAIHSQASGFSVPDLCDVEIDCKLVPPDSPASVLAALEQVGRQLAAAGELFTAPAISFTPRPTPFCAPYKLDRQLPFVQLCQAAVTEVKGSATVFVRQSVADECIYAERLQVPAICIGPSGGNAHQADEYVELASLADLEQIYLKILHHLDRPGGQPVKDNHDQKRS